MLNVTEQKVNVMNFAGHSRWRSRAASAAYLRRALQVHGAQRGAEPPPVGRQADRDAASPDTVVQLHGGQVPWGKSKPGSRQAGALCPASARGVRGAGCEGTAAFRAPHVGPQRESRFLVASSGFGRETCRLHLARRGPDGHGQRGGEQCPGLSVFGRNGSRFFFSKTMF